MACCPWPWEAAPAGRVSAFGRAIVSEKSSTIRLPRASASETAPMSLTGVLPFLRAFGLFSIDSARQHCFRFRGWAPTKTCNEGSQVPPTRLAPRLPLFPGTNPWPCCSDCHCEAQHSVAAPQVFLPQGPSSPRQRHRDRETSCENCQEVLGAGQPGCGWCVICVCVFVFLSEL